MLLASVFLVLCLAAIYVLIVRINNVNNYDLQNVLLSFMNNKSQVWS